MLGEGRFISVGGTFWFRAGPRRCSLFSPFCYAPSVEGIACFSGSRVHLSCSAAAALQETRCRTARGTVPACGHSTLPRCLPARSLRPLCNCRGGGPLIVPAGWCRSCWPGGGAVFPEGSGCSQFACTGVTEQARSVPSTRPARSSRLTPKSAWSNGHLCGALFRCSFSADIIHCCQFLFLLLSSQAPALARHIVFTQDITLLEIYFMQRCTQMQQVML